MDSDEKVVVDLNREQTEAGWLRSLDNFGLKVTPLWFKWLSWILLIGIFQLLFEQSTGLAKVVLGAIVFLSLGLLWMYFVAVFYRLEFMNLPLVRSSKATRIVSLIISGLLAYVAWKSAVFLVQIVKGHT